VTRSLASSPSNPAAGAAFPGTTKRVAPNSRAGFRVSGCGMATGLITVCRVLSDVAPWRLASHRQAPKGYPSKHSGAMPVNEAD
jgi:hypothetical protein